MDESDVFETWLRFGFEQGWIGPPVCASCDGIPESEDEYESGVCVHIVRLYQDELDKMTVEQDHSPSVWRATNRWGKEAVENPKTLAEQLDSAPDGNAFGDVLQGLFAVLEKAMDDEKDDDQ